MQTVTAGFLEQLRGSHTPTMTVDAWYDGRLVLPDVPVAGGTVTVDRSRVVLSSLALTAVSSDTSLVPTGYDSPLAPYGSELQVRAGVAGELVSLGWYRIDSCDPREEWSRYPGATPAADGTWVGRSCQVTVQASDRMSRLDDARFLVPEAPPPGSTVLAEIRRLARDLVPIADLTGVTDAAIPGSIVYQTSRTQALQDLAGVLTRTARINPSGALTLVPSTPGTVPVWTVKVGDTGEIVDWGRKLDRSELYNAVISSGTTADGAAVQGVALETDGPLRHGGPFGVVPYAHSSPLLVTAGAAQADSRTRLATLIRERVVAVRVSCVANPALEADDVVGLQLPDRTLIGVVASMSIPLPLSVMEMVVMVPRAQLWG